MFQYWIPVVYGIFIALLWHVMPDIPSQDTQPNHNDQCWMLSRWLCGWERNYFVVRSWNITCYAMYATKLTHCSLLIHIIFSYLHWNNIFGKCYFAILHSNWKSFSLVYPLWNCEQWMYYMKIVVGSGHSKVCIKEIMHIHSDAICAS